MLSSVTVPLLGIVDVAVVGHLDAPHYLGAVALGAVTFSVLYFAFVFLRMGTTGLAAQAFGRGDHDEIRAGLGRGLLLAAAIALLTLVLGRLLIEGAVWLADPGPQVAPELRRYLEIRLLGLPAGLAGQVILGWLLGLQNARGPMVLLIATNAVNIALDLLFVLGLGWKVEGVAAATVLAEIGGLGLGIWLVRRELARLGGAWSRRTLLDAPALRRLLALNRDIFVRSLALQAAFFSFAALGARQGETVLAANAVLMNLQTLAAFGLDGFAHAAEAMVGRQIGARDRGAFRAAIRANLHCAMGLAVLLSLGFLLAGPAAIALMTGLPEVRAAAAVFLPYMVVSPLISIWAFLFDGVFIGATRTVEMRNGMVLALALYAALAFALIPPLGNHGLWIAFLGFMAWRGLWLGAVFLRIEARPGGFLGPGGPTRLEAGTA
jgi:multidrug resistance protein, MATE family